MCVLSNKPLQLYPTNVLAPALIRTLSTFLGITMGRYNPIFKFIRACLIGDCWSNNQQKVMFFKRMDNAIPDQHPDRACALFMKEHAVYFIKEHVLYL